MRTHDFIVFCAAIGAVTGCAAHPAAEPRELKTCVEGAAPANVSADSFAAALRQAQQYSDEKYGSDCFVCAEVFDEAGEYMLHITSPFEDLMINTSAAITVRKSDGMVTERSIWHSCQARIKKVTGNDASAFRLLKGKVGAFFSRL